MTFSALKKKNRNHQIIIAAILFFCILIGIVLALNMKNVSDLRSILTDSVESQLLSITVAAQEIIDPAAFEAYDSWDDIRADQAAYDKVLAQLRQLRENVGAEYIYALKMIDGAYRFVFDTGVEDNATMESYELSPVYEAALLGKSTAGVMNVVDEYGSFNTGAAPVLLDGKVVGILGVDIRDTYLKENDATARRNTILLIATLLVTMGVMLAAVVVLVKRVQQMQARLEHIAHYDAVTGLPNRQFLLEQLAAITSGKTKQPFALLFIDLDNFKKVNDSAGHDAGDELLRSIAQYLTSAHEPAMAFRPSAGALNIAARIGGDEFIQLVPNIKNEAEVAVYASRLLEQFNTQLRSRYIDKYNVGMSIGVALYPYHTDNYHVLIKYADIAMYNAKQAGKNCFCLYNDEMKAKEK